MIVDNGKYYLYRHIRLDKNEPFYIGIGTKKKQFASYKTEYKRAFSLGDRNKFWRNIVKKAGYEVEILVESNDYKFIKSKEREFIKVYGRRDVKRGELTNLTDGGEGESEVSEERRRQLRENSLGKVGYWKGKSRPEVSERNRKVNYWNRMNEETRLRLKKEISDRFKNRKLSKEHLEALRKPVIQMTKDGTFVKDWPYIKKAAEELKIQHITCCCKGKRETAGAFRWKYKDKK